MARPTLLVAEPEPGAALSTRKLVLETGKFNVLTAHSSAEAAEIFRTAPEIMSALIVVSELEGAQELVNEVKRQKPDAPVICLAARAGSRVEGAGYRLDSHEPEALMELCRQLFGDPRRYQAA